MTGMKTGEQGKWGSQLIYSSSFYNERPGVWMAVMLVSLSLYRSISQKLRSSAVKKAS